MKTGFTITKQQFYIASLVCICVLIVAACYGWFSGRIGTENDQDIGGVTIGETNDGVNSVQDTNATPDKAQSQDTDAAANNGGIVVSAPQYALPCEGEILRGFSDETLIYSKTLDQYMGHLGVDFGAPVGTPVTAAANGLVSKVTTDDEMGVTVWIAHPGEVTVVYSNLDSTLKVEEGDEIFKGDIIGVIGETSILEKKEEPHLHLEVLLNGVQVDPNDYFQF